MQLINRVQVCRNSDGFSILGRIFMFSPFDLCVDSFVCWRRSWFVLVMFDVRNYFKSTLNGGQSCLSLDVSAENATVKKELSFRIKSPYPSQWSLPANLCCSKACKVHQWVTNHIHWYKCLFLVSSQRNRQGEKHLHAEADDSSDSVGKTLEFNTSSNPYIWFVAFYIPAVRIGGSWPGHSFSVGHSGSNSDWFISVKGYWAFWMLQPSVQINSTLWGSFRVRWGSGSDTENWKYNNVENVTTALHRPQQPHRVCGTTATHTRWPGWPLPFCGRVEKQSCVFTSLSSPHSLFFSLCVLTNGNSSTFSSPSLFFAPCQFSLRKLCQTPSSAERKGGEVMMWWQHAYVHIFCKM